MSRCTPALALLLGAMVLGLAAETGADDDAPICPVPVSLCSDLHLITPEAEFPIGESCPPGSQCTCVPSCPTCRDCPVRVCVAEPARPCRTACDCDPGLGCFEGRCVARFAPVFCCESPECPAGHMCQGSDGRRGQCGAACVDELWLCDATSGSVDPCDGDRACTCTPSCPGCEDCGPPVCLPEGSPVPYRCDEAGGCARPGDRCVCVGSCPGCGDCELSVCVPSCDGPRCEERVAEVSRRIERLVDRAGRCRAHNDCVQVSTTTECRGTCGAWVNEHHVRRVRRHIGRLNDAFCSSYLEDGCPFATPACLFQRGLCVDGRCRGISLLPHPVSPEADFTLLDMPIPALLERLGSE